MTMRTNGADTNGPGSAGLLSPAPARPWHDHRERGRRGGEVVEAVARRCPARGRARRARCPAGRRWRGRRRARRRNGIPPVKASQTCRASSPPPPTSVTAFCIRWRKSSSVIGVRATPTIEKPPGSRRRTASRSIAGMSLRAVRSPEAPNTTRTAGGATRSPVVSANGLSEAHVGSGPRGGQGHFPKCYRCLWITAPPQWPRRPTWTPPTARAVARPGGRCRRTPVCRFGEGGCTMLRGHSRRCHTTLASAA